MSTDQSQRVRVLVADDDDMVLDCYKDAFDAESEASSTEEVKALDAELFGDSPTEEPSVDFDIVSCHQGAEAVSLTKNAIKSGDPFDVIILDIRMPPGINGVEAGKQIRDLDPEVSIIFVSGFSDIPPDQLGNEVPPPEKVYYYSKPLSFEELAHTAGQLAISA